MIQFTEITLTNYLLIQLEDLQVQNKTVHNSVYSLNEAFEDYSLNKIVYQNTNSNKQKLREFQIWTKNLSDNNT
jgi:hypothetical protein